MPILDFFNTEKRAAGRVAKAVKRLTNAYMQPEERMKSADYLQKVGDDEAIYGLLKRFTMKSSNQVVDEDEKTQVYGMIVGFGGDAVPSILRFIRSEDQILHPLKALTEIQSEERVIEDLEKVLSELGTDYMKKAERKLHLVQHVASLAHDRVIEVLSPFVEDHDETVRFQVVSALSDRGGAPALEALERRLASDEDESLRVRQAIAEALVRHGTAIAEAHRARAAARLPAGYSLDAEGRVRKGEAKAR